MKFLPCFRTKCQIILFSFYIFLSKIYQSNTQKYVEIHNMQKPEESILHRH